ncbi:MAG: energy-coupling factor transporter transmembrane protein EcfT [Actinomycetales bacterium]|jgi:energy-coupling factor transport system permease protein|nr:energy-coupling factor transporter transmembrane protein EcfT [Candidatus Phosphoribacter baldrii]MBK7609984.1 energy-coupling factor transporter transmembrane protein EcfT [Candidatus Phosphoribacter baldrii]HRC11997.1 energy-coupling factor transporter transmembrane component T [Dermatophilaceae bacterium]
MPHPTRFGVTPRMLHPVAWWVWGVGLATAAAHTTNPWLLLLIVAVAGWVVMERREVGALDSFRPFLLIGLFAIALRVVLTIVLGNGVPGQVVLVDLPQVRLPSWFAGLRLGGAVTLESVVAAAIDGLRLATTLACLGAANALASPRRLLRYAPATLYDIGTAVVVALTFAPALVDLAGRVRAARRLRGHSGRGLRELARLAVPVLEGALDRSLDLAASMESRGYGRTAVRGRRDRIIGSVLALTGSAGTVAGLYGVLSSSAQGWLGLPMLGTGLVLLTLSLVLGARRDARTAYRRDPWRAPEWVTCALGVLPAALLTYAEGDGWPGITLIQVPLDWPPLPALPASAIGAALLVAWLTPVPPRLAHARATILPAQLEPA